MSNSFPNRDWNLADEKGQLTWDKVPMAILMDIRTELKTLNRVLACPNFVNIPRKLDRIARNTAKKRKKKVQP